MGVNLPQSQASTVPAGLVSTVLQIPSTSLPVLGSYVVFDIKQKGLLIHNIALNYNMTAISGLTGGTLPRLAQAWSWATRFEIVINGVIVDTCFATEQFFLNQILYENSDRIMANNGAGNYASATHRNTMGSTSGQNYVVNLHTLFDQINFGLLTDSHSIQLRVYLDTATNIIVTGGATGTGAVSINFANLIVKCTQLSTDVIQNKLALMQDQNEHYIYHGLRYGIFAVNAGVTSSQIVLSSITGKIAYLFFTVRAVGSTVGDGANTFLKITNFSILDATSSNITSGQPITDALSLNYLSRYWTNSSYLSETATGTTQTGTLQNNGSNVYVFAFSSSPMEALTRGKLLGSRSFVGNEQLLITYTGTTVASVVEVYAMTESLLEVGVLSIKSIGA
jgi:hypothetical protein